MSREITPAHVESVKTRIRKLTPESARQWGTMTPNEMVVHLSDSLREPLGDKPYETMPPSWFRHVVLKTLVLWILPRYAKGAKARASITQGMGGTKPAEFARDVAALDSLNERFVKAAGSLKVQHARFGPMREKDWLRWWYMHTDHHLRQFGV